MLLKQINACGFDPFTNENLCRALIFQPLVLLLEPPFDAPLARCLGLFYWFL